MERDIIGVRRREKISNKEVRRRTGTVDVGCTVKVKKFKYAGHIMRGSKERWGVRATEWILYGNRRGKGRPGTRCGGRNKKQGGTAWEREVWNREALASMRKLEVVQSIQKYVL